MPLQLLSLKVSAGVFSVWSPLLFRSLGRSSSCVEGEVMARVIPVISTKKTPCIKCIIQQKSTVITFINGRVTVPESAWTDSNHWPHWPHSLTGKVGVCTHEGLFNGCSLGQTSETLKEPFHLNGRFVAGKILELLKIFQPCLMTPEGRLEKATSHVWKNRSVKSHILRILLDNYINAI